MGDGPASLMHKNPQRQKIILSILPIGCKDDRSEHVRVKKEYPVCVISVAVIVAVVSLCIFLLAFVVL